MSNTMFEKALRAKVRFNTSQGMIATEDLWELNLNLLDDLAVSLYKETRDRDGASFIKKTGVDENAYLDLKFELVKYVIETRLADIETAKMATERKNQKDAIMAVILDKQNEELRGRTVDDLKKMLDDL